MDFGTTRRCGRLENSHETNGRESEEPEKANIGQTGLCKYVDVLFRHLYFTLQAVEAFITLKQMNELGVMYIIIQ